MRRPSFNLDQNESKELCFDPNEFLKESFSIDVFLRNHRNQATLEVLRNDLGTYLKTLRLSMIELINKDYEDFVSLSKDLVGLNAGIEVLQGPLEQVRAEIIIVKNSLEETISGMKSCLEQDKTIKEKKQSLFHLSQVIESSKKLNRLLKDDELSSRSIDLDLIERAATELTTLQFSVSRCQAIMSQKQKEDFESLRSVLMDLLNNTFLECLCERQSNRLHRCLRLYVNLDKVAEAEMLIRKEVIAPYLYDLINETSLQKEPDGLKGIYQKVLEFIEGQLATLLKLDWEGDFLLNGLWIELSRRIEIHMGSVFAAGDPQTFHTRFMDTSVFLSSLRKIFPNEEAVAAFNSHPNTSHFLQKWNLLVYYKIRFQEIAGQLESVLSESMVPAEGDSIYQLKIPFVAFSCLQRCWDRLVFIPELAHSFWRLSLQIIARYHVWLTDEAAKDKIKYEFPEKTATTGLSPSSHTKDSRLRFLVSLQLDTARFSVEAVSLLTKVLENSSRSPPIDKKIATSLIDSSQKLNEALSLISDSVVSLLVRDCVLPLSQVNDIPRLFRRTNRETPTKPCEYVQQVLQPLITFYNDNDAKVPADVLQTWIVAILSQVSGQFYSSVSEVLKNAQKTEESIRRLKKAKDKSSNSVESKGTSDNDKIRQQLVVDVHAYCAGTRSVGVEQQSIVLLRQLVELVETAKDNSER